MAFFNMDWFKVNLLGLKPDEPEPVDLTDEKRSELEKDYLLTVEYDQVDHFHLKGFKTWAKVVRVYDADTIYVVVFLSSKPFKFKVRLDGIDTAELRSKDPLEIVWAEKGKERLIELIGNQLVWLECGKYDKYGRVLAKISSGPDSPTFNDICLKEGYGYRYRGKKRRPFRDWAPKKALGEDIPPSGFENSDKKTVVDQIRDPAVINKTEGPNDYQPETNAEEKPKLDLVQK